MIFGGNEFVGRTDPGFGGGADVSWGPAKANKPPREIIARMIADLQKKNCFQCRLVSICCSRPVIPINRKERIEHKGN